METQYFVPRVLNSNSYSGYMEDMNWITVGSGEKLWPNWRVNSRLKTFKFKLKKSTE